MLLRINSLLYDLGGCLLIFTGPATPVTSIREKEKGLDGVCGPKMAFSNANWSVQHLPLLLWTFFVKQSH